MHQTVFVVDNGDKVMFVIDNNLMNSKYLECHPCINTATLKIKVTDLLEKINYATGIIWQVRYSVKGDDYRFKSTSKDCNTLCSF